MRYDISKPSAPKMPKLGKGTECIKLLLSQASKDMHEPLVPMFFPILGAHISVVEFLYSDLNWKDCVAKWLFWWQKVVVIGVNYHICWRLFAVISARERRSMYAPSNRSWILISRCHSQIHNSQFIFWTLPPQTCMGSVNIFKYIYNYINIIREKQRGTPRKINCELWILWIHEKGCF